MIEKNVRVAIYARVSTEEQAEHGYSIDAQIETLRNYCMLNNKIIYKEYVDRGVSGKSIEGRFELQRLLKDVEDGHIDEIVVWKINRLARKMIDLLKMVDHFSKYKAVFRSFTENFETETAMGKFALQMLGAVGELERNTIVENVKMGMKQRARTGSHNGGVALGYRSVSKGDKRSRDTSLEIVPEEAALVRRIFDLYASGKGLRAIANQLNHDGYKTKKGNPFSTTAIKEIVTNPLYTGIIRYNRFENWNEHRRKGKSDNTIIVEGNHEAIIPRELWEKVQILHTEKSKINPRVFDGQYLLTGLIRCPECGAPMVANRTKNKLKNGTVIIRRYYSCSNFRNKGTAVCHANSVGADYAEQHVLDRIRYVISNPQFLQNLVDAINNRKTNSIVPLQKEKCSIEASLAAIEDKRKKYFALYEEDAIDREMFVTRLDQLTTETEMLHRRQSEIEYELGTDSAEPISADYILQILKQFDALVELAALEQKKTLLRLMINEIHINEKREIMSIELAFDEQMQTLFLKVDPSARKAEGSLFLSKQQAAFTSNPKRFTLVL
ncbi:recombinase family protein [Brevibacillus sp. 179-C9.3 HS]|uniref:recombinase family protein n=1 Tax=unclassified Brevibacillus TaxID=2684853 RepID=UPI0039A1F2B5